MGDTTDRIRSVEVAGTDYWQRNIPCQHACPVHTDARGYVRAIAEGDYQRAYLIARGPNPLASLCGRICGAPCEQKCRRGEIDRPIAIRALKRFAMEKGRLESLSNTPFNENLASLQEKRDDGGIDDIRHLLEKFKQMKFPKPNGEKVAIVGSGPAGLACAHDLCLMGFRPVIFEMEAVPAGMLYVGVPEYRLPRDVIRAEVALIEALGTEIRCNTEVGVTVSFPDLLNDFKSLVIAVGGKKSRKLPIEGVEGPGVLGGVEFLREVAYDRPPILGEKVVVIGGGNVAYDAARTTLRQTYVDVSNTADRQPQVEETILVCLESLSEMPADDLEIHEGHEEGITRMNGWGPTRIIRGDDGKVTGVEFQRCLRAFNEEGRFAPKFDPEQKTVVPCNTVIVTIGQQFDLGFLDAERDKIAINDRGLIVVDPEDHSTSRPGVFVAGDLAVGLRLMIDAVASGKRAARGVYKFLTGKVPDRKLTDFHRVIDDYRRESDYETIPRVEMPVVPPEVRRKSQKVVVEQGYSEVQAGHEASRCLDCGVNTIFDGTKCILCGGCVDVCPTLCLKIVPVSSLKPTEELSAVTDNLQDRNWEEGSAIVKNETRCIRCANCAHRCPTGAITMEKFCYQESWL